MGTMTRRTFVGTSVSAASLAVLAQSRIVTATGESLPRDAAIVNMQAPEGLVIGIGVDPQTLDPRRTEVTEALPLTHVINEESLFRDEEGTVVPYLAASWEYPDDTTLVLHLQDGLSFSNGEPFDATAVKYTIESVMDPANAWVAAEKRGWFEAIDRIDTPDDATVSIALKEPNHAVLSYLTLLGIVPPKAAQAAGEGYGTAAVWNGSVRSGRVRSRRPLGTQRAVRLLGWCS